MKNNKRNASFISNQKLIEGMMNKSAKHLSRNRSVETNISLIERKNYDHEKSQINLNTSLYQNQNISLNSNFNSRRESNIEQNASLMKFLKNNISNKNLLNQAEKVISETPSQNNKGGISKQEVALMVKIEQLYLEKTKLKKQKKALEQKLQQQIKSHKQKQQNLRKQNERLHKIVLKQSEVITNQTLTQQDGTEELRKILLAQAKTIETLQSSKSIKNTIGFKYR